MKLLRLKSYGKQYGWGTVRSLYGFHSFEFGGKKSYSLHFWPFILIWGEN